MIYFKTINEFYDALLEDVKAKKEVYVFDDPTDFEHDLTKDVCDGCIDYRLHPIIDMEKIQRRLMYDLYEYDKDLWKSTVAVYDLILDDEKEDGGIPLKRLAIFQSTAK